MKESPRQNIHRYNSRSTFQSLSMITTNSSLEPFKIPGIDAVAHPTKRQPCFAYALIAPSSFSGSNLPENHLSFCVRTLYCFIRFFSEDAAVVWLELVPWNINGFEQYGHSRFFPIQRWSMVSSAPQFGHLALVFILYSFSLFDSFPLCSDYSVSSFPYISLVDVML